METKSLSEEYRKRFLEALQKLKHGPEIDFTHVEKRLSELDFPQSGMSNAFTAYSQEVNSLAPYQALIVLSSAPHFLSLETSILEYKIVDIARSRLGQLIVPLFCSVFPNGRMVLGVSGLLFDSEGVRTEYEPNSLFEDKFQVTNPRVLEIYKHYIESFPQGNAHLEDCRRNALFDLAKSVRGESAKKH